jgi:XTP/dITP diphosphohydrolase
MDLLFATTNINKTNEIKKALPHNYNLISLKDIDLGNTEVEEPYLTLEENAIHKALSYNRLSGLECFAEDTGLEVESLNGQPGVMSARYAGIPVNERNNIEKLLHELKNHQNRKARFRTVIALMTDNKCHLFEGVCNGRILEIASGGNGFGYDPIFLPFGADKTFADMTIDEKNHYSHRRKALLKLIDFLEKRTGPDSK